MDLLDKLDLLMARDGLNKRTLSQLSGVPYMTISDLYKKGYKNTKISTIRKIAHCLDVTIDYLVEDSITNVDYGKTPSSFQKEKSPSIPEESEMDAGLNTIITCYQRMSADGRQRLVEQAEFLLTKYPKQKIESGTA